MTPLSNAIAAISHDFVIVLDDYHYIQLPAIHDAPAFLLNSPQGRMHLIIATQADPPLLLARLRARGQLAELRAADLRFSVDEAAEFLNDQMSLNLTRKQVATLEARAEGWIVGLQLAALSMRGHPDVAGFIGAFTGNHHFILEYLVEEVLQRQTPAIQDFLLHTSILEQMNAALADAVTGQNDGEQTLRQLEKANLFVIPLDDARHWYRYHRLFAEFLHSRLLQSQPEQVAELCRRASLWYEQNGFDNESVDYALAGPDFERAALLIERIGQALLLRSEDSTVLNWLARLPDELVRRRPLLCVMHAVVLGGTGRIDLAAARLALVDDAQLDPAARWWTDLVRAGVAFLSGSVPQAIEYAYHALEAAKASRPDPTDLRAQFNLPETLASAAMLSDLQLAAGQLHAAVSSCRYGLEIGNALARDSSGAVFLSTMYLGLAEVSYEWNELRAAAQQAAQALECCRAGQNREVEADALAILAQIKQAQGDRAGAVDAMQQAEQLVRQRNIATELRAIAAWQVNLLVAQGRIDEAARVVSELPQENPADFRLEGVFISHNHISVSRARLLVEQREFGPALLWLEALQAQAQTSAEMGTLITVLALSALARHGQGQVAPATEFLARALALAEPEGYIRTFVDLGEPMRLMIAAHVRQSLRQFQTDANPDTQPSAGYLESLFAAFPLALVESSIPQLAPPNSRLEMVEPLSLRESMVLQPIAEGLSNQAIGERLVVTVSTVKTHIYNIFGKLGVRSRTQALARARELKWL